MKGSKITNSTGEHTPKFVIKISVEYTELDPHGARGHGGDVAREIEAGEFDSLEQALDVRAAMTELGQTVMERLPMPGSGPFKVWDDEYLADQRTGFIVEAWMPKHRKFLPLLCRLLNIMHRATASARIRPAHRTPTAPGKVRATHHTTKQPEASQVK